MPLSTDKIENRPFSGAELLDFILWRIKGAALNDYIFNSPSTAYPGVAFEVNLKIHFASPIFPPATIRATYSTEGPFEEPPLKNFDDTGVRAMTIKDKVDNPNLARVHADIPIKVMEALPPGPGKMIGTLEEHTLNYDKHDLPPLAEPEVTDTSETVAKAWGATSKMNIPKVKRRARKGDIDYLLTK